MRIRSGTAAYLALAIALSSCSDDGMLAPLFSDGPRVVSPAALPAVRISELHYDNGGTDAGEAIEISGPAGTDLTGWSVVLYNGSNGSVYDTDALGGVVPATCDPRGVVVLNYPVNGIQNGSPDGIALVGPGGVVEFLSYEGVFVAVGGPADGMTSTDIGVSENGSDPTGLSLQRTGGGTWNPAAAETFGACNDDAEPPEVDHVVVAPASATVAVGGSQAFTATAYDAADQPIGGVAFDWSSTDEGVAVVDGNGLATGVSVGDAGITAMAPNGTSDTAELHVEEAGEPPSGPVFFSEIHYDNDGTDMGEAIEVEGPAGTVLTGWSVVLYNGNGGGSYGTTALSGAIPDLCDGRGVVVIEYPSNGVQNGSPDGLALVDGGGLVIEFLSYEGVFAATNGPAAGVTSTDIGVSEGTSSPVGFSLKRHDDGAWHSPSPNSFGACNGEAPPPPPNGITFSGRSASDPPLPVGFQDQLFATLRDGLGGAIPSSFVWSSDTPGLAGIDADGVVTALAAGTAVLRATAEDGTTETWSVATTVATPSTTALYEGNAEFGEPADGDSGDDFLVHHTQYTASYNPARRTPNWVSYEIEATHFGSQDRCDCFTFDPGLPMPFVRYTTADYTGAGAFHGYGIDRGHLARSFDRTAGSLDNAVTFYFTNIVPQAADLNQGPWAALENDLGDRARFDDREVYVVAGVAGSKGTLKDEGVITIPAQVWKVAVIMPRDQGLDDVNDVQDLEVLAVIMPNEPGVRNVPWQDYLTTVDAVEALSGYDLLDLLPDPVEIAAESGTSPPTAASDGPYASTEGASVSVSGAGSTDPDGQPLTYAWSFGDGGTGSGVSASHTWTQDGVYAVRLIVTDPLGLADTTFTTATVANVAPAIGAFPGATILPGETYGAVGGFTDPGADVWSATIDYGDGSGVTPLALGGTTFSLSHLYAVAGTFTVTVRVSDDDATSTRTATVVVQTPVEAVGDATGLVEGLEAGGSLGAGNANALLSKLEAAAGQLGNGHAQAAAGSLRALLHQLDAFEASGSLSAEDAAALRDLIERILASLGA